MKKKLLATLLSVLMLLACIPLGAVSVSAEGVLDGLLYEIANGEVTITGYTDDVPEHLVIPATIEGYPVKAIGNGAFNGDVEGFHIVSVVIAEGVETIGEYAFCWTGTLISVEIPDTVTYIGKCAFWCSNVQEVNIPNGITTIEEAVFCNARLTSIVIPKSVTTIKMEAFWGCDFTSLVIPDSVTYIGDCAFQGCEKLTAVVLPDGLETIPWYSFAQCYSLNYVVFPKSVKVIDGGAFQEAAFTEFVIPDGVTTIGEYSFAGCANMKSITVPESVETIDKGAFAGCSSLTDVYYAGSREDVGNIVIGSDNTDLINATWHYNSINPKDHYSDDVPHSVMDTENGNGLAFKFELAASVSIKGQNKVNFTNATINYLGEECKLVGMGAVITNQENVTLDLGNVNGKTVIDISTVYLTDWEPDSCAFAARVINIPNSALERVVYARPYYIVEVDGEQIVVYGDIDSASCAEYM